MQQNWRSMRKIAALVRLLSCSLLSLPVPSHVSAFLCFYGQCICFSRSLSPQSYSYDALSLLVRGCGCGRQLTLEALFPPFVERWRFTASLFCILLITSPRREERLRLYDLTTCNTFDQRTWATVYFWLLDYVLFFDKNSLGLNFFCLK